MRAGRAETALEDLRRAYAAAELLDGRRAMWRVLPPLIQLERKFGNEARAEELLAQGHEVIEYIADHLPKPEHRQAFLELANVRAITEEQ